MPAGGHAAQPCRFCRQLRTHAMYATACHARRCTVVRTTTGMLAPADGYRSLRHTRNPPITQGNKMNKRLIAIGLALALGGLSTSAFAANAGDPGQFYIGANVGQAKWDVDHSSDIKLDDSDTAASVRFGYVWHWDVDFAVEGGYTDLGEISADWGDPYDTYHQTIKGHEVFAGVKVKYGFAQNWYVSGRAGIAQGKFESSTTYVYTDSNNQPSGSGYSRYDETKTGWYAGVGIGYDFSRHFSLGLAYDYHHNKMDDVDMNVGTVTIGAEYRF